VTVRFLTSGDTGLIVEFGDTIDRAVNERVLLLNQKLNRLRLPGVIETIPTFRSLLVLYDPVKTSSSNLKALIAQVLEKKTSASSEATLWRIPVCYAPEFAPDLPDVCARTGLSAERVVALHLERQYRVYMLGFLPGFPYMGDLAEPLRLPRRADPRTRVPAGSVAIATSMTGIYPVESPGGWHLIGRTPIKLFDLNWDPPSLLAPGDVVMFEEIGVEEFRQIEQAAESDLYRPAREKIRV